MEQVTVILFKYTDIQAWTLKESGMENPKLNEAGRAELERLIFSSREVQYFLKGATSQMTLEGKLMPRLIGIEFVPVPEKETMAGQ